MRNTTLAMNFALGWVEGHSKNMHIFGDKLFSYHKCIAIRCSNHFIVSNRAVALGGQFCSRTTSGHITHTLRRIASASNKKVILVDGWAELGKPEWHIPPTHKTIGGLMRAFANLKCSGWVGKHGAAKRVDWQIKNDILLHDNTIIVFRKYIVQLPVSITNREDWQHACNNDCDICPARFICKKDTEYSARVF